MSPQLERTAETLTKTIADGRWSGAGSQNVLPAGADGFMQVTIGTANQRVMLGLSDEDTNGHYRTIDFAFYVYLDNRLLVFEEGQNRGRVGAYQPGDVLQIERVNGEVRYLHNGAAVYTSAIASMSQLVVDTSFYDQAGLSGIAASFDVTAAAVLWDSVNPLLDQTGQTLTKTAADGRWSGAGSRNVLPPGADGYAQTTIASANQRVMFGLSEEDTNGHYRTIDFAFYVYRDNRLLVFEEGQNRGRVGAYQPGDVLRIERVNGVVRYLHNGAAVYTSAVVATSALVVDVSFYDAASLLQSVAAFDTISRIADLDLTSTGPAPIRSGDAVVLQASSHSANSGIEYRYWLRRPGAAWQMLRDYNSDSQFLWNTTGLRRGDYLFEVHARIADRPAEGDVIRRRKLSLRENTDQIWQRLITPFLTENLWNPRDAYDAAHFLMIPLQHAFAAGDAARQQEFAAYFERLVATGLSELEGRLTRLQHLYLASRFVVLAEETGRSDLIPAGLASALAEEVERMWVLEPAWQWGRSPFPGGMSERIRWKLDTHDVFYSHYRAIIDEELFTIGIAADMKTFERLTGTPFPQSQVLDDILDTAREIFTDEVVHHPDGGWLLQPGVWTDHPDVRYAGHDAFAPDLAPAKVPGISWDTSHSHRMPMLLTSLAAAFAPGSETNVFYSNLKSGLELQFFQHVLVEPSAEFPGYRTTNYLDGRNGLYRHYPDRADVFPGYGPYQVSGTMFFGWWSGLDTQRIREVYRSLSEQFPLTDQMLQTYDITVSRDRHPIVYWDSGVRELLVLLAAENLFS